MVPRQSDYPVQMPPLPAAFRAREEPPMPYNASYPFAHNQRQPSIDSQSSSFDMPGENNIALIPRLMFIYKRLPCMAVSVLVVAIKHCS